MKMNSILAVIISIVTLIPVLFISVACPVIVSETVLDEDMLSSESSDFAPTRNDEGLVAQWVFDEGGGGHVNDSSGNGNNGTLNAGGGDDVNTKWVDGVKGFGLDLDGVNDYVNVPRDSSFEPGHISIEVFINPEVITGKSRQIINHRSGGDSWRGYAMEMGANGDINGAISTGSTLAHKSKVIIPGEVVETDKWHYIVLTWDGHALKIFLNGKLKDSDDSGIDGNITYPNLPLRFGYRADAQQPEFFSGIIDEISIYNRTLSGKEIEDRHNETMGTIVDISASSEDIVLSNPEPDIDETIRINATIRNNGNEGIKFQDDFEQNNLWAIEQTTGGGFSTSLSEEQHYTGKKSIKMTGNDNLGPTGHARISRDIDLTGIDRVNFSFRNGQNFIQGARKLAYWVDGARTLLKDLSQYKADRWYNHSIDTSQRQGVHTISLGIFNSGGYVFAGISFYFDTVLGYQGIEATVSFFDGFPENGGEAIGHKEIIFLGEKSIETTVEWSASEGRHDIVVIVKDVEPEDEKPENNIAVRIINVPGDLPDISIKITDISLSDNNFQVGDTMRIEGMVRNLGGDYYPPWWYSNWLYRKFLIIDNTQNEVALDNYSVSMELEHVNGMKDDFSDIRFADLHGNELSYWIETRDIGQKATVWIKLGEIPGAARTQALLYYGNEDAESASSPGKVFEVYDEFDSNEIDAKIWRYRENGGVSVGIQGGNLELRLNSASLGNSASISSKSQFTYPVIWEARVITTSSNPVGSYAPAMGLQSYPGAESGCSYSYHNQIHVKNPDGNSYNPLEHNAFSSNWKTAAVIWNENSADFLVDGQTKLHATEYIPSSPMACFFSLSSDQTGGTNNKYIKVDWVKVRKYTAVPPTVTVQNEGDMFTANVTLFDDNPDTDGQIIGYNNISGWNKENVSISFNWTPLASGPNELFMRIGEIEPVNANDSNNMVQWIVEVLPEDRAPQLVIPILDLEIPEDDEGIDLVNLSGHFKDINIPQTLLNFTLVYLSPVQNIEGRVEGIGVSFFSSIANWSGKESFIINCTNGLGLWTLSNIFNVTVNPVNDPPNAWMTSPLNGQTFGITEITFSWNASDIDDIADNITFDIYLDESDPPRLHTSDFEGYNFTINDLKDNTKYYWYVRPHDGKTKGTCLNNTWNFTINSSAQLPEVEHISPENGAIINGSSIALTWKLVNSVGNNIRYEVFFGSSEDDLQIVETITSTYYNLSGLVDNKTYYWKIIPFSDMLRGVTRSGVWEFTVLKGFVAEYSIEWSAEKKSFSIEEGQSVLSINVSIENKGNTINSISIKSSGELAGKISFSSTNIELDPGETRDMIVTIITSSLAIGKYAIAIELHHEGGSETIEFSLIVQAVRDESSTDNEGMNTGLLLGIIAVVLIGIVMIVVIIVIKRRRKDDADEFEEVESDAIEADIVHAPLRSPTQKGTDQGYPAATMEYPGGQGGSDYYYPPTAHSGTDGMDAHMHFDEQDESQHTPYQEQSNDAELRSGLDLSGLHLPDEIPSVSGGGSGEKILALPPARILNVEKEKQKVPIDELFLMTSGGLLVQHYSLQRESGLNEDILAGMLTAVRSFILDSLSMVNKGASGDRDLSIDMGQFSVMMASGNTINLVAISDKDKKEQVMGQLGKGLEAIERTFGHVMESWDGDMSTVAGVQSFVESLVKGELDEEKLVKAAGQSPFPMESTPLPEPPQASPELPSGRRSVTVSLPDPVKLPDTTKALPEKSEVQLEAPEGDEKGTDILAALDNILSDIPGSVAPKESESGTREPVSPALTPSRPLDDEDLFRLSIDEISTEKTDPPPPPDT